MTIVEPSQGVVLARISSEFGSIPVPEKSHDSMTWGQIIGINEADKETYGFLLGRVAYWRRFKDDARIDKHSAFIEINDILGSSYDDASS